MQLATSQRAHPPPVPPRPSRQVVAEALKRSPRPPCPTRQAPPPPNTKPWRSDDKDNAKLPKVGRTIVYESVRDQRSNDEPKLSSPNDQSVRPLASPRFTNDETVASSASGNIAGNNNSVAEKTLERGDSDARANRDTSERNEVENQRERQQRPQPRTNGNERCDRENSTGHLFRRSDSEIIGSIDGRSTISPRDNVPSLEQLINVVASANDIEKRNDFGRDTGDEIFNDEKSSIVRPVTLIGEQIATSISRSNQDALRNSDREYVAASPNRSVDDNIGKTTQDERTIARKDDVEKSFGKKSDCQGNATTGKSLSTTPTKIEKISNNNGVGKVVDARDENGETISGARGGGAEDEEEEVAAAMSGSTTTISSDDRATVVVIDEPERKIAFNEDNDNNIHHQDWLEAGVRYSSTKITLPGDDPIDRADEFDYLDDNRRLYDDDDDIRRAYAQLDFSSIRERIAMSSLQGLPPLPRSLSGFNLSEGRREVVEPPPPPARSSSKTPKNIKSTQPSSSRPSPPGRQLTTLDTQLAILRKEMFGLRQLDLSLLSQLWSLNESIQEFRQLLQEQEDRAPSPSPSSEEGDDNSYGSHPPPPPRRPAPLLHHHRPPRPPRPLRPPASDESPSSEEYGAV